MNKRKIILLATTVCMIAILAVGGTMAYFTDNDKVDNVFTVGNVKIALEEEFEQESPLYPGLDVNKDVYVANNGSVDAYVRVHIAIPASLDDGDPAFDASKNMLHFNFTDESVADGQWSWLPTYSTGKGYKGNGAGNFNYYTTKIDGVEYAVYVVTYRTALKAGEVTKTQALDKVYLDKKVDATATIDGRSVTYTDDKGNSVTLPANKGTASISIKVVAEATQTATFTDAYNALNTAFGVPSTASNPWNNYGK